MCILTQSQTEPLRIISKTAGPGRAGGASALGRGLWGRNTWAVGNRPWEESRDTTGTWLLEPLGKHSQRNPKTEPWALSSRSSIPVRCLSARPPWFHHLSPATDSEAVTSQVSCMVGLWYLIGFLSPASRLGGSLRSASADYTVKAGGSSLVGQNHLQPLHMVVL